MPVRPKGKKKNKNPNAHKLATQSPNSERWHAFLCENGRADSATLTPRVELYSANNRTDGIGTIGQIWGGGEGSGP